MAVPQDYEHPPHSKGFRQLPLRGMAVGAGILVASVAVLYLVGINVFLRTRLFRNAISADPIAFRVEYKNAYSIVPGRIHVEGLTIRGRDSSIEWILATDNCDFRVAFLDLIHKRFRASHVRASGFTIRVRLRIPAADATPELVAALPPVPGFADPPYAGAKPPPLTDAHYNLWMVQLDDVDVQHVREVWIHSIRVQGEMRVRGRWVFRPLRWLEVGPASVDVSTLDISTGTRSLATGLHGSIDATVHPFDLRKPNGLEVLEYVSTKTQLAGIAMTANVLNAILPSSYVTLSRAEGPLDAYLLVDHGALVSGTHVWTDSADTELAAGTLIFDSSARLDFRVEGPEALLHALGSGVRVSFDQTVQAQAASLDARVVSHHLEAAHAFDDATFAFAIQGAETKTLAEWEARFFHSASVAVRADLVTASCAVHGSMTSAAGTATILADDVAARVGPATVEGKLVAHVSLQRWESADNAFDLSGSEVLLRNVSVRGGRAPQRGAVILTVPSLAIAASRLTIASGSANGDAHVVAPEFSARFGSTTVSAGLKIDLKARRDAHGGSGGEVTNLSGSRITITQGGIGQRPGSWWGNFEVRDASLRTRDGATFQARVRGTARDAGPATALVADNAGVPAWAANAFLMPDLQVDGEVRATGSSLELRSVRAQGGEASVRMEYAKRGARQEGAMLLDLGWVEFGYDLSASSAGLVLLGSEGWFDRKSAMIRADVSRIGMTEPQSVVNHLPDPPGRNCVPPSAGSTASRISSARSTRCGAR